MIVLPLPEVMGSTWNLLASLGLWWWQHMIVKDLNEHCKPAEVTGCRKTIFITRIQLCPSDRTSIPFKQYRRRFTIKITFAVTIRKAQGKMLKRVAMYPPSPVFPLWPALCDIFPILFIWQHRCCSYSRTWTAYRRWKIDIVQHCISRCALKFRKYIRKSLLIILLFIRMKEAA